MNRRLLLSLLAFAPLAAHAQEPNITGPQPELPKEKLVIITRDGVRHEFNVEMALTPATADGRADVPTHGSAGRRYAVRLGHAA